MINYCRTCELEYDPNKVENIGDGFCSDTCEIIRFEEEAEE